MDPTTEKKKLLKLITKLSNKIEKLEEKVDKLTEELSELRYLPSDIERMQEAQTKTDNDLYDLQIRIEELRD